MSPLFQSPANRSPAHNSSSSNVRGPDLTIYVSLSPPDGTEVLKMASPFYIMLANMDLWQENTVIL